jgi:hypothetical protein
MHLTEADPFARRDTACPAAWATTMPTADRSGCHPRQSFQLQRWPDAGQHADELGSPDLVWARPQINVAVTFNQQFAGTVHYFKDGPPANRVPSMAQVTTLCIRDILHGKFFVTEVIVNLVGGLRR